MSNKTLFAALFSTIFAAGCAFDAADETAEHADGLTQDNPAYVDEASPPAADPTASFDDVEPTARASTTPGHDDVDPSAPEGETQPSDIEAKASGCSVHWVDPETEQVFEIPCSWPGVVSQRTK